MIIVRENSEVVIIYPEYEMGYSWDLIHQKKNQLLGNQT